MPSLFKALDVMAKSFKGLRGMVGSLEDVIEGGVPLGEVYELAASFRGSVQAFVDTVDGALKHAREASRRASGERSRAPQGLGTVDNPASGIVAQVLYKTGLWMKDQGKIQNPPTQKTVASFIDASFAQNVIDKKCPQ